MDLISQKKVLVLTSPIGSNQSETTSPKVTPKATDICSIITTAVRERVFWRDIMVQLWLMGTMVLGRLLLLEALVRKTLLPGVLWSVQWRIFLQIHPLILIPYLYPTCSCIWKPFRTFLFLAMITLPL